MGDSASQPIYLETVPRQGYRFVALADAADTQSDPSTSTTITVRLQKAIWANFAELRMAEARRRKQTQYTIAGMVLVLAALIVYVVLK